MKIAFLAIASIAHLTSAQEGKVSLLRGPDQNAKKANGFLVSAIETTGESSCMQIHSEDECNGSVDDSSVPCVWCKCAAIPSECLSVEQSAHVPAGVFDCAQPPQEPITEESKEVHRMERLSHDAPGYDGSRMTYALTDDEVDGSLCDPNSKSLSGYMDISGSKYDADGENKHLFYWFFEKRSNGQNQDVASEDIPLILWLTGGPGCSSTLALLTENGPCSVNPDGKTTSINDYSWTETAHVLWLDQPAGVGYSYGSTNDYNEEMISEDAFYFLQEFYKEHPQYSGNPLTVVGESYGGHYAPAIAHKIWTKNNSDDESLLHINLAGLAVGNGLTNPIEQYKWYPEMAFKNSHGIKTVSEETYNAMKDAVPKCVSLIEECNKGDGFLNKFACQTAFILCNTGETAPYQMSGLNPYDIRKECGSHPLCYDFTNVESFLNLESTKEALHISKESGHWESCNMGINLKFHTDWMKDFSPFVADLLDAGIPALIYAGDVDFICNYLGNKAWTLGLEWSHNAEFNAAEEHEWGEGSGKVRTAGGLTFMQVYDAGHMVPSDQPQVALDMIRNFVMGGKF